MRQRLSPSVAYQPLLAPMAVCAYVLVFAAPLEFDLGLFLLATLGGLAAFLCERPPAAAGSRLHLAVYIFLAVQIVSTISSMDVRRSFTLGLAVLPGIAIFFLIADYFDGEKQLQWLFAAHSLLGLLLGAGVLATLWRMDWVVEPGYQNWISQLGSPVLIVSNDAVYLALLVPLSVALLLLPGRGMTKAIAAASLLSTCALAGLMQSRLLAGMLLLMLLLMALLLRPRWALPAGAIAVAAIAALDAAGNFPLLRRFALLWQSGESPLWDARIPIWQEAWHIFLRHPLLGEGAHTFSYVSVDNIAVNWAHNLFLETAAEQGIVGLAALCILLGALAWTSWENFRQAEAERRILAAAVLSVVFGALFGALFELSFVRQWVNEILFFALGAAALSRRMRLRGTMLRRDEVKV